MGRVAYLMALAGCGLWYLTFGQWLSWVLLLALAGLPFLSLALSAGAIADFEISAAGPEQATVGQRADLLLMGSCGNPMPPFRGKIRLRERRTGLRLSYREDRGFVPQHCGGYDVTVEKARVGDYLGLFFFPVRNRQVTRLLVRPTEVAVEDLPGFLTQIPVRWRASPLRLGENYELRPYRPGDSLNSLHWKLTAKTGKLMVREAMEPLHPRACLTLTLAGSPEQVDDRLGRLLWIGRRLLEVGMEPLILAASGEGTLRYAVPDEAALRSAVDDLLCRTAPQGPELPEPVGEWHYALGGDGE